MLKLIHLTYNLFQERTIIAHDENGRCVVVDPGFYGPAEKEDFFGTLAGHGLKPEAILLTHGHLDHIYGVQDLLKAFAGIPVYMNAADAVILDYDVEMSEKLGLTAPYVSFEYIPVREGQTIEAMGLKFEVIETPGHTPGSVCYLERSEKILFSGDTLFAGTIGRTDMLYGEYDDEIRSIMEKIILLDPDITIVPGHGPDSTIGHERTHNPFLEPFNEPEENLEDVEPVALHH